MWKPECLGKAGTWRDLTGDNRGLYDLVKEGSFLALDIETYGHAQKPGCVSASRLHGIYGLALANMSGDAGWVTLKDCDHAEFFKFLNPSLKGKTLIFHNGKFDLGFLQRAGLDISQSRVVDTWLLHSIECNGVFKSGKLKDLVRAHFQIETNSEEAIKAALALRKTEDYGEIPVELLAPYACDDVRYAMALFCVWIRDMSSTTLKFHDLYLEVSLLAAEAENRGLLTDDRGPQGNEYERRIALAEKRLFARERDLQSLLAGVDINFRDDQELLRYLYSQGMGNPPSEMFGEVKFRVSWETLFMIRKHPVGKHVFPYFFYKNFLNSFSPKRVPERFSSEGSDGGVVFHPSFLSQVFGRGGEVRFVRPDFREEVPLTDMVKGLFRPRKGFVFAGCLLPNLNLAILARLTGKPEIDMGVSDVWGEISDKLHLGNDGETIFSCLAKQVIDGFGMAVLKKNLASAGASLNFDHFAAKGKFDDFFGIPGMRTRIRSDIAKGSIFRDICGRKVVVPPDKEYRAVSVLLRSSFGNLVCSLWRDLGRTGKKHSAVPVCFDGARAVFEVPADLSTGFTRAFYETFRESVFPRAFRNVPSFFCPFSDSWPFSFSDGIEGRSFAKLFKEDSFGETLFGIQENLVPREDGDGQASVVG